ncbi:hypothetical protein [Ruminococcus albus]|uniref:hypothetical protein n=1 Tax=Ruminococcus albus TaxID=1264 RepID=UPI000466421A|nr:hypothetical protein [Ruminococcus albus]
MLFFNPLRRRELEDYKDKIFNRTKIELKKGSKYTADKAEKLSDSFIKFNVSRRTKKGLSIASVSVAVFLLSVYIPSWITGTEKEEYYSLPIDPKAIEFNEKAAVNYPDEDFDGDGITNSYEILSKTDIFSDDTDGDGFGDKVELALNTDPVKADPLIKAVKKKDKAEGKTISDPYKDDGVILWADSYEDKANGYVIKDKNGYYIRNFKGWAQFPETLHKYVYNYNTKAQKLEKMKYRKVEDAYYINKDSYIVILDNKPKYKYTFSAFGTNYKLKNAFFGNTLAFVLPAKGKTYLKCQKTPLFSDSESKNIITDVKVLKYTNDFKDRMTKNTNTAADLSSVLKFIESNKCVYVSLFGPEEGESVGIVYGYTPEGDLLVADPETGDYSGKIKIKLKARKIVDENNEIGKLIYFDFTGLGFDSEKGSRINFFGTETSDDYVDYFS